MHRVIPSHDDVSNQPEILLVSQKSELTGGAVLFVRMSWVNQIIFRPHLKPIAFHQQKDGRELAVITLSKDLVSAF